MTWARTLIGLLAATCVISCAGNAAPMRDDDRSVGTLVLTLTGSDRHGQRYRLRNAEFDISGYNYLYPEAPTTQITVSTETDLDAPSIVTEVVPGQYGVTLSNRFWYLEKLTDQGAERVDDAVLLSPESQYVYVSQDGTSRVYFAFGVDGELIDFRHGTIEIGILIEHPDDEDAGSPDEDAGSPDEDAGTE
jgi:hypothetical protein